MTPVPCHDLSPLDIEAIENKLYAFNSAVTGCDDAAAMGFLIRNGAGEMIAVANGYSLYGLYDCPASVTIGTQDTPASESTIRISGWRSGTLA